MTGRGPLDGLLVIDTSWGLPGSLAGMLLADYGARVVKLERPAEMSAPGTVLHSVVDRGKWSIALDPAAQANAATVEALLDRADILVESGAGAPIADLAPDRVAARHPHLVQCHISAYGVDGPLCSRPGYDSLVAARLGMMVEQPGYRAGPVFLGHPAIDYVTAFLAAIGVLAAVRARNLTGRGQFVDTSLLDGALAVNSMNWWYNERNLSYLARSGDEEGFGRNRLITDLFECGDGEYLMMHTGGDGGFKRMMDVLGFGDIVRDVIGLEMATPLDDDEYHAARHLVPETMRRRSRDEWIKLFHAADLAALPVLRPQEVFDDEQVRHSRVVVEIDDPSVGPIRQFGPVVEFRACPAPPTKAAPVVGADSARLEELLAVAPQAAAQTADAALGAPLEGLRVLDFSAFFATAFGARLLSDLGADVIKVEPLRGDQMRPLADLFEGAQRGKRNLAIDLRTSEGAEVVRKLVATADVVMHNLRPGKAEKLGIGFEQCVAINPSLIYCYLPGFGSTGPKAELKSFAPLVSGFTGMLYIGAGEGNPPVRRVLGNEDLYNGFLGALSVLMAIAHRDRTGEGQYVESPHLNSSLLLRTEQCTDVDGKPLAALQLDAEQTGWGPLYRLYRTSDDWIALACVGQRCFARLAAALGRPDLATDPRFATEIARAAHGGELVAELIACFATVSSDEAFGALDRAGVPCEVPVAAPYLPDFLWDEWAEETGRVFAHTHPEHGYVREIGHCVRFSATPLTNRGTSARLGQHTVELLDELGYSAPDIERLLGSVCSEPAVRLEANESQPTEGDS